MYARSVLPVSESWRRIRGRTACTQNAWWVCTVPCLLYAYDLLRRELRAALENLRRESAAVRVGLSRFRQQSLLPSLDITKQQRAKLLLQREMHQLLYVQRVEAILMAAENSCVNRQLPLQAALLMEGAALFLPPSGALPPSALEGLSQEIGRDTAVLAGTKKVRKVLLHGPSTSSKTASSYFYS